jgi:hypothetical protein
LISKLLATLGSAAGKLDAVIINQQVPAGIHRSDFLMNLEKAVENRIHI